MSLTRADLETHRLQTMIEQAGIDLHILTEVELRSSIDHTLSRQPKKGDVWLFAYGSLIWNPVFEFCDRQVGHIYGYHRRFCLWTPVGRGTPNNPGLVLGLDRGGSCRGIVYRLAANQVESELLLVWRREMVVGSYIPRWVRVSDGNETIHAITFVINPAHSMYAKNLTEQIVAQRIATAAGNLGSCSDYLFQTVDGLLHHGIRDRALLELRRRVVALREPAKDA